MKTMNMNKKFSRQIGLARKMGMFATAMVTMVVSASAMATTTAAGGTAIAAGSFNDFVATILAWTNGALGVGLAVTALVIGGGIGLMKASPLPALSGLGLAAIFAWGPSVIQALVTGGAMIG